jgi:hypothetical protein
MGIKPKISLYCEGCAYQTNFLPRRKASRRLRDHRCKNQPGDLDNKPEKTPMIAIAGDLTQMDEKTLGNTNEVTSTDVSESGSCMEVDGDEEWMRDYEEMEEEDMGDWVMINQEGDITKRYCQMFTTRPDWTTDHLTGMTRSLPSCERLDKIIGTGPVTTPLNTNGHIDPVARLESFRALKLSRLESFRVLKC